MSIRLDSDRCVSKTRKTTYCGRTLVDDEWTFCNAKSAIEAVAHGSVITICPECKLALKEQHPNADLAICCETIEVVETI